MKYGERTFGHASLRLCSPSALPLHMRGKVVELRSLRTDPEQRRQGHADQLLRLVTVEAERSKKFLLIKVEPEAESVGPGGPDREALAAFYDRHGFVAIQPEPLLMVRPCIGVKGKRS